MMRTNEEWAKEFEKCAIRASLGSGDRPASVVEAIREEWGLAIAAEIRNRSRGMSPMGERIMEMVADIAEKFGDEPQPAACTAFAHELAAKVGVYVCGKCGETL